MALAFAQALPAAQAQSLNAPAHAALVREAFRSGYGEALTVELGKALRAGADPACLASNAIAPGQLESLGLGMMVKWGTRMMETSESVVDKKLHAEKFPASAEFAKLQADRVVARYVDIAQPMRQARILDSIFEQFDRYVLLKRIKLAAISPAATGNEALLNKNPSDATEAKLDQFMAAQKSAALKRYLVLAEQDAAARAGAVRQGQPLQPVPTMFLQGIEADLAELCIANR